VKKFNENEYLVMATRKGNHQKDGAARIRFLPQTEIIAINACG
jgi:hypothetical protein